MRNMSRTRSKSKVNSTTNNFSNFVDIFNSRYYIVNKRILCYIGQWPYQTVFERSIRSTFLIISGLTIFVPQTLHLIRSWGDAASFIEGFSPLVTNLGCHVKLLNFVVHTKKVKRLLDELREDWECSRPLLELKILHEHGRKGMRYTLTYLIVFCTTIATWTSVPLIPLVMDMVAPLNESRPHVQYYATDYCVDPDKYYYPIFFHSFAITVVGMPIFVAVDTFFMMISQHTCAMLNILSYIAATLPCLLGSIEQLDAFLRVTIYGQQCENLTQYRLENMTQVDNKASVRVDTNVRGDFYYQQIVACIMQHKRAIDVRLPTCSIFAIRIWRSFRFVSLGVKWNNLTVQRLGLKDLPQVCPLISLHYQVAQKNELSESYLSGLHMSVRMIVAKGTSTENVLRCTFFTFAQVLHLFCNTLPGHWIMETSSGLPFSAYSCNWYLMSPSSRRLIVLFIRRSIEPCLITAGKMYVMSMENLRCVLQTSVSYMTLLTSTQ